MRDDLAERSRASRLRCGADLEDVARRYPPRKCRPEVRVERDIKLETRACFQATASDARCARPISTTRSPFARIALPPQRIGSVSGAQLDVVSGHDALRSRPPSSPSGNRLEDSSTQARSKYAAQATFGVSAVGMAVILKTPNRHRVGIVTLRRESSRPSSETRSGWMVGRSDRR